MILGIALFCVPTVAAAQTAPLIIDRQRTDRTEARPGTDNAPTQPTAPQRAVPDIAPFTLTAVQIQGASIDPAAVTGAAKPFIGQTIDGKAVNAIADAIAGAYGNANIALYTVLVPKQDFAGGILRLVVQEGYIDHVDLQGDVGGDLDLVKAYAQQLTVEKPLSKARFQRYLSLIRDIPGLKVDAQLLQGKAPGATELVLKLTQKKYLINLGISNRGASALGSTQLSIDATYYGLFREGEQTTLTLSAPTEFNLFQYVGLNHAEPINDNGTVVTLAFGYLHTKQRAIPLDGNAETLQIGVVHPLIRSFDENLFVAATFDGLNSANATLGSVLSNERIRALRGAATYTVVAPEHLFTANASISFGLDILGARTTSPLLAEPSFQKLNLRLGYNQLIDTDWVVRLRALGQISAERLPTSEFLALGGGDFGRGFAAASIIGDSGFAGSAEIAWHPAQFPIDFLKGTELYVYADDSQTRLLHRGLGAGTTLMLASAGFGIRVPYGERTSVEFEVEKPLYATPILGLGQDWRVGFAIKTGY